MLNTFLSKMIIYPKKMRFLPKKVCFLYFSCSPHSSTRPNCLYNLCSKSGQKIGKEFDPLQVLTIFFSRKKPDPENPGKIRIWNSGYFWSDFENEIHKIQFYGKTGKFLCNFWWFWHFQNRDLSGQMFEFLKKSARFVFPIKFWLI